MAIFKGLDKTKRYDITGAGTYYDAETKGLTGREIMSRDDWHMCLEARPAGEPDAEPVAISRRRRYRGKEAIVMTAATTPSSDCWGTYRRVAVVIVNWYQLPSDRELPAMISDHARGVVRVVATWEDCNVGTTERCAFRRAKKAAQALADKLNKEGVKK